MVFTAEGATLSEGVDVEQRVDAGGDEDDVVGARVVDGGLQRRVALDVELRRELALDAVQDLVQLVAALTLHHQQHLWLLVLFNASHFRSEQQHPTTHTHTHKHTRVNFYSLNIAMSFHSQFVNHKPLCH